MNIERIPGTIAITVTGESLAEADALEDFLRHRVDSHQGDKTELNARIAKIQQEIAALEADIDHVNPDDPTFAFFLQDRRQQIGDLNALIRIEERRAARPVITARNP